MSAVTYCGSCGCKLQHRIYQGSDGRRWESEHCWTCGYELTAVAKVQDFNEAITSDEIITVHEILESEKAWEELTTWRS